MTDRLNRLLNQLGGEDLQQAYAELEQLQTAASPQKKNQEMETLQAERKKATFNPQKMEHILGEWWNQNTCRLSSYLIFLLV